MRHVPLVLALFALPAIAAACPVCGAATENNRMAYLGMTIFMTLLPLAGFSAIAYWVWKRSRDLTDHPPQL